MTDPATGGVGLVWGVEPMCAVLSEHGIKISPSTYYEWVDKQPTRQQLRDEHVTQLILQLRERNKLNKRLGSRKVWIKLRGEGHDVARCTIERLMRVNGWEGARYGSNGPTRPMTGIPIWSTATSPRWHRTGSGWLISPTCRHGPGWSTWRS